MDKLRKKYLYLTGLSTLFSNLTSSSDSVPKASTLKIITVLLSGLILIGFGVLAYKTNIFLSGDKVEVLNNTTEGVSAFSDITVEIAGAIEKPAVYKLSKDSRVDDLLIVSGGLSADADRGWVEKNINRASKLVDGQKLYIYSQSEIESASLDGSIKLDHDVLGASSENYKNIVNINTASPEELEKLNGIGPVYAQKIIDGRIYSNAEELVSKKIIPQKTYEKIKSSISL